MQPRLVTSSACCSGRAGGTARVCDLLAYAVTEAGHKLRLLLAYATEVIHMDEVFNKLNRIVIAEFTIFGFHFELSNTLLCVWIVCALLIVVSLFITRGFKERPGKRQIIIEMLAGFIINLCRENIGEKHYRKFVPIIGTMFLFICMSNLLAVFNFIPGLNLYPPTKDINVTLPLALMSIFTVLIAGILIKGPIGTFKDLFKPMVIMFPFKLMEYITKPLSLCLRLFGNILAAFVIMELVYYFAGLFAAPFSAYFDFFDGILQAYIFVFLTCIYIGELLEEDEEDTPQHTTAVETSLT